MTGSYSIFEQDTATCCRITVHIRYKANCFEAISHTRTNYHRPVSRVYIKGHPWFSSRSFMVPWSEGHCLTRITLRTKKPRNFAPMITWWWNQVSLAPQKVNVKCRRVEILGIGQQCVDSHMADLGEDKTLLECDRKHFGQSYGRKSLSVAAAMILALR